MPVTAAVHTVLLAEPGRRRGCVGLTLGIVGVFLTSPELGWSRLPGDSYTTCCAILEGSTLDRQNNLVTCVSS